MLFFRCVLIVAWLSVAVGFNCNGQICGVSNCMVSTLSKGSGWYIDAADNCQLCPSGSYCDGGGAKYGCTACSGYFVAACSSASNTVCCGSSKADTWCVPVGYYNEGGGNLQCRGPCEAGLVEFVPCSPKNRVCGRCETGTYFGVAACSVCEAGSYCVNNTKHACPGGTTSPPSAGSVAACTQCATGQYILNGACVLCEIGSYCAGGVKFTCPNQTTSFTGATGYLDCRCQPGTSGTVRGPNNATCVPCPKGYICAGVDSPKTCDCKV